MPNIITHTLFARDMLEDEQIAAIVEYPHLFETGSNGPDFLFFHHLNPLDFYKKTPLRRIGSELHHSHINAFYGLALDTLRKEKDPELRRQMTSYILGHLCHWALDSSAHPYIFYRTGDCKNRSSWNHHRMESLLDAIMLRIKKNGTVKEYPLALEASHTTSQEKKAISRLYGSIVSGLFEEEIDSSMIAQCLLDWQHYQKLIYDPRDWKYPLLKNVEKPLGLNRLLSGLIVPMEVQDDYDLLNLMHDVWKHPVSEQVQTASFLDLYEQAQDRAKEAILLFDAALADRANEKALFDFLADRNYNMGVSRGKGHLFDPIQFSE